MDEACGPFAAGGHSVAAPVDLSADDAVLTLPHLRRVAALLKQEATDELLRDMILEANGGAGVARGVRKDEFENVMRRAGVWR